MSFDMEYKKLNSAQKQAVDTIEGPVMVVAGPGTGKTHILTLRIANILRQTDTQAHNILALTFTDSAAKTMRSRLIGLIGQPAYNVRIETFHALCDSIIREYPEFFPFQLDSLPLTQVEQFNLIRSLLDNPSLKFLRTPGSKYHYARDLVSAISSLKREGISNENLEKIVGDETEWFASERESMKKIELLKWEPLVGKHKELVGIYQEYQKKLQEMSRYDFDDMLLEVHNALQQNPLLLSALQEQFQYILVDEYQDTNGVQNAIVDTIASFWEEPNLFVVGDPNQTIFRFQGALLENTLGFLDRYPSATVITLGQGYRSNQQVYSAAHNLIGSTLGDNQHPLTKNLGKALSASHKKGKITLETTESDSDELLLLTENIKTLITSGVPEQEIAVLYKRNADGEILSDLFSRASIPFHTERDINALEDETLVQFFDLLTLLHSLKHTTEERLLFDVLGYDWFAPGKNLSQLTLIKLIRAFASQRTIENPFEFLSQDEKELKKLTALNKVKSAEWEVIKELTTLLTRWSLEESQKPFPDFLQNLAQESGLIEAMIRGSHQASLPSYIALFKEVQRQVYAQKKYRLTNFLEYLSTMQDQSLSLSIENNRAQHGVTLSTVHKAKGKEWEHVFIPFLREGYWGKSRGKSGLKLPEAIVKHSVLLDPEADERRLLFVALTRAKNTAHLSFSKTIKDGDRVSDVLPSPYLQEIKEHTETKEVSLDSSLNSLFISPPTVINVDAETRVWLADQLGSFTLSYSSMNAYLEDPKKFYERYVLKLPEIMQSHLAFGNAIHTTLEHYFKTYKENENSHQTVESVIPIFERQLKAHKLAPQDEQTRLDQGRRVLAEYLTNLTNTFPQVIATEESFGWKRGKILLGQTQLVGKIDRIDLIEVDNKHLKVIDYKTGKPKTLGDIEGKTKSLLLSKRELELPENIRGRMKRQLLFYKLLLSLDPKYKHLEVNEGVFEFVEPDKGKFVSRSIPLLKEDVDALKELVMLVDKEIKELKFLDA